MLIDFLRYTDFEHERDKPGIQGEKRRLRSHLVFVVSRQDVQRIDLGTVADIDAAVRAWRDARRLHRHDSRSGPRAAPRRPRRAGRPAERLRGGRHGKAPRLPTPGSADSSARGHPGDRGDARQGNAVRLHLRGPGSRRRAGAAQQPARPPRHRRPRRPARSDHPRSHPGDRRGRDLRRHVPDGRSLRGREHPLLVPGLPPDAALLALRQPRHGHPRRLGHQLLRGHHRQSRRAGRASVHRRGEGGNAGVQTLTIIVRGLALGDLDWRNSRRAFFKELGLGLANGAAVGAGIGVLVWMWRGNACWSSWARRCSSTWSRPPSPASLCPSSSAGSSRIRPRPPAFLSPP